MYFYNKGFDLKSVLFGNPNGWKWKQRNFKICTFFHNFNRQICLKIIINYEVKDHVYVNEYVYTCTCMNVCMCVCMYVYMRVYIYACICVCVRLCIKLYVCMYICMIIYQISNLIVSEMTHLITCNQFHLVLFVT